MWIVLFANWMKLVLCLHHSIYVHDEFILGPNQWRHSSQWINSLWPSEAIWQQSSGSTLAQVMACYLTAPSHYLHQCWKIISKVQPVTFICVQFHKRYLSWQSLKNNLKITYLKFYSNLPGTNELMSISLTYWALNKMANILQMSDIFKLRFHDWNILYFDLNFTGAYCQGSIWQ